MKPIDWSKAPEGYPLWIESLSEGVPSGWYWIKPEGEGYLVYQPPAAPWDGIGPPPVGTVCEAYVSDAWRRVEVFAHKPEGEATSALFTYIRDDGADGWFWFDEATRFRPLRTPEQIAAEKREKTVNAMVATAGLLDKGWCREVCAALYDAGYRKVEGGEQ